MPAQQAGDMPTQKADTMPTEQANAYPTPPDSSQPIEPGRQLDMHYYLTEGLEDVEHHEYCNIRSFKGAVDSRADALRSGKSDEQLPPYLIFSPVTPRQLVNIDRVRKIRYKRLRFLYLNEPKVLIVKNMLSPENEMACKEFVRTILKKIDGGGRETKIVMMGSTTYQGKLCCKEADASFRPRRAGPERNDWPTMVVECGVTETPRRLAADAHWWIENSEGAVKLVLLLFVSVRDETIRVELWKRATAENPHQTRWNDSGEVTGPTLKSVTTITSESITGAHLKIKFRDIFLRKPKPERGEGNYFITEEDMRTYYDQVWSPASDASSEDEYAAREEQNGSSSSSEGFVVD